jgi:hypothetical protein
MCPLPHDGSAEEGLCDALLQFVDDDERIDRLRQWLSGFNHRCRNLLNGMKMSLYLVKRCAKQPLPDRWVELEQTYHSIEQLFDRLQLIYRPMSVTHIRASFGSLVSDRKSSWREKFATSGGVLEFRAPDHESQGEFDPMLLTLGFDAFVAWRASSAIPKQHAQLSWQTVEGHFEVVWQESRRTPRASHRRSRCPTTTRNPLGQTIHSLALPLLTRVAAVHHGTIEWIHEPVVKAHIRWPLNQSVHGGEPAGISRSSEIVPFQ